MIVLKAPPPPSMSHGPSVRTMSLELPYERSPFRWLWWMQWSYARRCVTCCSGDWVDSVYNWQLLTAPASITSRCHWTTLPSCLKVQLKKSFHASIGPPRAKNLDLFCVSIFHMLFWAESVYIWLALVSWVVTEKSRPWKLYLHFNFWKPSPPWLIHLRTKSE